jgi:hypothetical protein
MMKLEGRTAAPWARQLFPTLLSSETTVMSRGRPLNSRTKRMISSSPPWRVRVKRQRIPAIFCSRPPEPWNSPSKTMRHSTPGCSRPQFATSRARRFRAFGSPPSRLAWSLGILLMTL